MNERGVFPNAWPECLLGGRIDVEPTGSPYDAIIRVKRVSKRPNNSDRGLLADNLS